MIDTVILSLPRDKVVVQKMEPLRGGFWELQARTKMYDKYVRNPNPADKSSGKYFPRITGYRRKNGQMEWEATIRIEFSAPKLLFGNNLDELSGGQFRSVVKALRESLKIMGMKITTEDLINAEVTAVHYSKNVELLNSYTAQYVISELGKINLNKRFDLTRARFMNDGQSLYGYSIAHSYIIYDKIADLYRPKKRAIDQDRPILQLDLFGNIKSREVLRFEVRISKKQKLKTLFKQLGYPENPTFRDVFSKEKSKKILQHYWHTMITGNSLPLFAHSQSPKDLLKQILVARKSAKGKTLIYLTGLLLLAREGNGLRELRSMLSKRINDRTWYRLYGDFKETSSGLDRLQPRDWYDEVNRALVRYQSYRISPVATRTRYGKVRG